MRPIERIWIILLLLICSGETAFAKANSIKIKILEVVNRKCEEDKSGQAVLTFFFKNLSQEKDLIFFESRGWDRKNTERIHAADADYKIGDFSTLKYKWLKNEKVVITGLYEISRGIIYVKGNGDSEFINVPIAMPKSPGEYLLVITFDNTNLEKLVRQSADISEGNFFTDRTSLKIRLRAPEI